MLLWLRRCRTQVHSASNPSLIKDRRYFMKTHNTSFVASEVVTWLCNTDQAPNRDMAVVLMNILKENQIFTQCAILALSHKSSTGCWIKINYFLILVTGYGGFKDDSSFYRFTKDDGVFPWSEDLSMLLKGRRLFERCVFSNSSVPYNLGWLQRV